MKIRSFLLAVAFLALSVSQAHALPAPIPAYLNVGALTYGSEDTFYNTAPTLYNNTVVGSIPGLSKIVFTYDMSILGNNATETGMVLGGNLYAFGTQQNGGPAITSGNTGMLSVATSFPSSTKGIITITNLLGAPVDFSAAISATLSFFGGFMQTHYLVSAVPLPAALPLFGAALVGMAALRRRKNA